MELQNYEILDLNNRMRIRLLLLISGTYIHIYLLTIPWPIGFVTQKSWRVLLA